jgi:predicted DNA-binding transcriptional regulator AlpA
MEETDSYSNNSTSIGVKKNEGAPPRGNLQSNDRLVTTKEVLDLLSISRTTLWRFNKSKTLTPIKLSGLSRYRLSDVNSLFNVDKEVVS